MSWKAMAAGVIVPLVVIAAVFGYLSTYRPAEPALRHYSAVMGEQEFRVEATEARVEGFCTVFFVGEQRIAAVCGQHTWSEMVEVE